MTTQRGNTAVLSLAALGLLGLLAFYWANASIRWDARHVPIVRRAAAPLAQTYVVPGLGKVVAGTHATEKHLTEALTARAMLAQRGTECFPCRDGRTRCFNWGAGKKVAVGVFALVSGMWVEVTGFLAEEAYANEILCSDCGCGDGRPADYAW